MQLFQGMADVKDLKGQVIVVPEFTFQVVGGLQPSVLYEFLKGNSGNGLQERYDFMHHHVVSYHRAAARYRLPDGFV
jgi:hypothetical protein